MGSDAESCAILGCHRRFLCEKIWLLLDNCEKGACS